MLSIAEGSFEVFVFFQRAPEGNPLFHVHDQTHICMCALRVNGKEGIKQHRFVLLVVSW